MLSLPATLGFWTALTVARLAAVPFAQAADAPLAACCSPKEGQQGKEEGQLYDAIAREGFRFADAVQDRRPAVAATLRGRFIRDSRLLRDPDGRTFYLVAANAFPGSVIAGQLESGCWWCFGEWSCCLMSLIFHPIP